MPPENLPVKGSERMLLEEIGDDRGVDDEPLHASFPGKRLFAPLKQCFLEAVIDLIFGPASSQIFVTLYRANPLLASELLKGLSPPEFAAVTELDIFLF
jgi:hypothetical protein